MNDSITKVSTGRFFTRLDWAAFWTATLITFVVYFLTLGPSVGLEDSGELATAAANLGVPHPPGYPFWTFCSWLFCKAFGWVTYMGHPTPAWCVSLCSAVFGAFAAGCTAMLICRSSRDFIGDEEANPSPFASTTPLLAFGGGVAGALTFALSPVEWSQSTIVEIYSLNALFLMWVFLLSYRWMRRPTDKMLWFTAFVFGLGLTNYQVLLFAIVPLALVIFFKDGLELVEFFVLGALAAVSVGLYFMLGGVVGQKLGIIGGVVTGGYLLFLMMRTGGMFRDVFLYLIPVGLTWQILQIGQLDRADVSMQANVIDKHKPLVDKVVSTPSTMVIVFGLVLLVGSIAVAAYLRHRKEKAEKIRSIVLFGGGAGAVLILLSSFLFVSKHTWVKDSVTAPIAPLVEPTRYAFIAACIAASVVAAVLSSLNKREDEEPPAGLLPRFLAQLDRELFISLGFAVVAVIAASLVPTAGDGGYQGTPFPWAWSTSIFAALIASLFALTAFMRKGLSFSIPVAGLHIAAFVLLTSGAMNGLTHPCSWWFCWGIAWNFVLLVLAWITLPNGRSVAGAAFFAQLGVSFYVYMPIVSDLRNPPMNWGYPRTWEGFKHAIMRGQYEAIGFQMPKLEVILNYFEDVRVQFTDLLIPFALVPFAAGHWIVKKVNRKSFWRWMVPALVCFGLMSFLLIALANVKGDLQDGFIQKVKFIASHAMLALWIGYGMVLAPSLSGKLVEQFAGKRRFVQVCLLAPFAIAAAFGAAYGLRWCVEWCGEAWKHSLLDVRYVGVLFKGLGYALWLAFSVIVTLSPVALIVWGLTVVFALLRRLSFGRKLVVGLIVVIGVIGALLAPLIDNYCGNYQLGVNEVAFKLGGSEQNGHTFGWQFGAYQLEGAKAINDQIVADEEPLPDPTYPPPMDKFSIFFGGTDPGRFVPTYMIYSALYRPDVYLITQNALADGTYMSVERDLYGDEIWIPSEEDSGEAFRTYVSRLSPEERVQKGVVEVNGRVQVTGALSVMDINAILTEMMHEHDRRRHSFYVEESYVISWMYPYLSPHGLIMKINAEKTPYDAQTAAKDRDFWDWYTRRLLSDPMYRRDFAGQKSFSKLRSAIAGLYNRQGRYREGAQAFREACLLYPASPEASFRYTQENLLPFRKYDKVLELMDYTDMIDPNNRRTQSMRDYIRHVSGLLARLEGLEKRRADTKNPMTEAEYFDLAKCYYELGRVGEAGRIVSRFVDRLTNGQELLVVVRMLNEARMYEDAEKAQKRYLDMNPRNANAWADLSKIQQRAGKGPTALQSCRRALQLDRDGIANRFSWDSELLEVARPLFQPRR